MRERVSLVVLSCSFVVAMACGITPISPIVEVETYDTSCVLNEDCVAIVAGDVCAPCSCPTDAINTRERTAYERDVARIEPTCDGVEGVACGPCMETSVICEDSVCAIAPRVILQASDFDQSCEVDSDCVVVVVGDACETCSCDGGAISASAKGAYDAARAEARCGVNEMPCAIDCAAIQAACEESVCVIR